MTDKAQAERSPCEHQHVVSTGRDTSGLEWGRCADCGDDSFVISDPTANADGVRCGTFSSEKVRPLDGHMLAGILRKASRASHPHCGDGMTLPERIERMHSLLARWPDADHCHGHICESSMDGPCDVRLLEDETRAFLGERQGTATPKEAPSSDVSAEFERGRERGIEEAARHLQLRAAAIDTDGFPGPAIAYDEAAKEVRALLANATPQARPEEKVAEARDWLIWSFEHDAWWAPNECGYTPNINLAGRYTRTRAERIVRNANLDCTLRHEAMLPAPPPPRHRRRRDTET